MNLSGILLNGVSVETVKRASRLLVDRLLKGWRFTIIAAITGSIIALLGLLLVPSKYKAEILIAVEEGESSGWQNLLAQFGLDVGGLNPGGIFEGESLVKLFTTRYLVERTLLDKMQSPDGDSVLLVNYLYPYTELADKKEISDVQFTSDRSEFTELQDSVLLELKNHVVDDLLDVYKPDKKLSLIQIGVRHEDKYFAQALANGLVKNTLDFFLESITEKARGNLMVLRAQRDSAQRELNYALVANAKASDDVVNPLFQSGQISQYQTLVNLQVANALYVEIAKNLTLAEIGLRKQTPLIKIVERPDFPLKRTGFYWWQWMLIGTSIGAVFGIYRSLVSP
jgi:hypothetical protein